MAHFVIVNDPDHERRSRYLRQVAPQLHVVPGLEEGSINLGPHVMIWVRGPRAPFSAGTIEGGGEGGVVIGDALTEQGSARTTVEALLAPDGSARLGQLDGFHLAITFSATGTLTVGVDVLGLFPVYYWHSGGVLIISSSPESIRCHPQFDLQIDGRGLAGILLFNGLLGGRTLARGILRLAPGHVLVASDEGVYEEERYRPTPSPDIASLPLPRQVEVVDEVLTHLFRRHLRANEPVGFLMSGGMDSRMIAGYLGEGGQKVHALTMGLPSDLEMVCAKRVARALGFEHSGLEQSDGQPAETARATARMEWLATGFSGGGGYGATETLRGLPPTLVSGHVLDYVITTTLEDWKWVPTEPWPRWQDLLRLYNCWGIPPHQVRAIVRAKVLQQGVGEALHDAEQEFDEYSEVGSDRLRRFQLHNRGRFHVGGGVWRRTFATWPSLPVLDRTFLNTAFGLPLNAVDLDRLLQRSLLLTRFREIARMPFDKNLSQTVLLAPTTVQLVLRGLLRRARSFWPKLFWRRERRRYYRSYDFNNEQWIAVRSAAESCRARAGDVLDLDALTRALPPPTVKVHAEDPIAGVAGHKMLVGLLLWLDSMGVGG